MCGIWGYISKNAVHLSDEQKAILYAAFSKIKHRGPDRSDFIEFDILVPFILGFHRLAIMDRSTRGDQPFVCEHEDHTIYTLCNGELYGYKKLVEKFQLSMESECDCEVIPLIYKKYGIEMLVNSIRGEFAFAILDIDHQAGKLTLYLGRDHCGIRPLFFGEDERGICFSSELAGISDVIERDKIIQFPPRHYMQIDLTNKGKIGDKLIQYYMIDRPPFREPASVDIWSKEYLDVICKKIRETFKDVVLDMLATDRPLGAFLSGGLDSSLVVGQASDLLRKLKGQNLRTFCIGMSSSTDAPYALEVAQFCQTDHMNICVADDQLLDSIPKVVKCTGSICMTTNRASTPQYCISEEVSKKTDIKVLLVGDGSDELCSGYMEFHQAPTPEESHMGNCRRLSKIHEADVLRTDRTIARHGLEARCPFLSREFIDMYLSIDCRLRIPVNGVEKWLLRKAFEGTGLIPDSVLGRQKEAFSDSLSSHKKSWFEMIQEHIDVLVSDDEFLVNKDKYIHLRPQTKEQYYYRKLFGEFYGEDCVHVTPEHWLPMWCEGATDPSARTLKIYQEKMTLKEQKA
jgi:asparagine synthase (glutamine-hydrolysing)